MQIARVIGTVVATIKNEMLEGRKFLIVQTLNAFCISVCKRSAIFLAKLFKF
jgi:microcompartment protein CcmK/EutM